MIDHIRRTSLKTLHPIFEALLVLLSLSKLFVLDLLAKLLELALLLRVFGLLDALAKIYRVSVLTRWVTDWRKKNVRLLDKFGPDTFHVLIRFDHFSIIISWSREKNVVLGSKLSSLGDAAKCNLVAASENVNNVFEIEREKPTRLFLFANLDSFISKIRCNICGAILTITGINVGSLFAVKYQVFGPGHTGYSNGIG